MNKRTSITKLLEEIEEVGCSCDLLYGWRCSIHDKIFNFRKMISNSNNAKANVKEIFEACSFSDNQKLKILEELHKSIISKMEKENESNLGVSNGS